ncbi:MAG: DUF86 domain-containing protein [Deltaproteobacteria bacterium]|jgi:uncharacterized protein with HEPN domain
MPPEDLIRLRHMLDSANEAIQLIKNKKREDLDSDRLLNLALVRLLEIVGEAASRTTNPTRAEYPEVPWSQIISLRNRLIHGYDEVDLDILWKILIKDLPQLIDQLAQVNYP